MTAIEKHQKIIADALEEYILQLPQTELYSPLKYFLSLGGKRLRPVLCLLAIEAYNGNAALGVKPALAIEVFHNFTLIHDDIMDQASLRRGQDTVHHKWDENTAILAGDALLIEAYKLLSIVPSEKLIPILEVFNKTAVEVCEGQKLDMDFEARDEVSIEEYLKMIRLKTSVLLGCSLKIGAILAGAGTADQENLFQFGVNVGIAFQLQDDFLDAFASSGRFGKEIGGDIIANKKTYLLLRAKQKASGEQLKELQNLQKKDFQREHKVQQSLQLFHQLNIAADTQEVIATFFAKAEKNLSNLSVPQERKKNLHDFLMQLRERQF